jgi:ferredoxin-NADP reductase
MIAIFQVENLLQTKLLCYRFGIPRVMTKMDKSKRSWDGETGYIDKTMLARFVPDVAAPIYYIAGPPSMVTAMKETLIRAGVNEDDIRSEDFAGY